MHSLMMSDTESECSSSLSTEDHLKHFIYESQSYQLDDELLEKYGEDEQQNSQQLINMLDCYRNELFLFVGSMGVFGPREFLCKDIHKLFQLPVPDGFSYVDSMLRSYMPKDSIFKLCCKLIEPDDVIDTKLYQLLVDTYAAKVDRQLKGSFEVVPFSAYENLITAVHNFWCGTENRKLRYHIKASQWNRLNDREIFKKLMLFWKFFDDDSEERITEALWDHILSQKIKHQAFFQLQHLQLQLDDIISHHSIFNTANTIERNNLGRDETADTYNYIRLFHDGNKKFMFSADVRTEVQKALKRQYRGSVYRQLSKFLPKIETDSELDKGRYFVIPYSKYLDIIDECQLERDAITLVNVDVERTRHLTVPIMSPYGTPCKPMADIFYEILSILTIELQAWWRIRSHQVGRVKFLFTSQMSRFVVSDENEHLVNVSYAKEIGDFLRSEIEDIIDECDPPLRSMRAFPDGQKPLTFDLLNDEVERLELVVPFPYITRAVNVVFAKNIGFRGPTLVTRLELTMMVQVCIALCLLKNNKNPKLIHILGFCDLATDVRCNFCDLTVKIPIVILPEATAIVQGEDEFEIKCDHFKEDDVIHASLFEKASGKKLVTSEMARSFVLQELLEIPMEDPSDTVKEVYSNDLRIMARKCCSKPIYFYMTSEEMVRLSAEVKKQFTATPNESRKPGIKGLLKFVNRCVEDLTTFADFSPSRVFYLKIRQRFNVEKGEKEGHVNSGELLEVVKILMDETKDSIVKQDWAQLANQKKHWHSDLGWSFISIKDALEILKKFPVNPQRLSFVPEFEDFFSNPLQNCTESDQIEKARKDKRIRDLEKQLEESNFQNTILESSHAAIEESLDETITDLDIKTAENTILKRRLADNGSKMREKNKQLIAQIKELRKQLQEAQRKNESFEDTPNQSLPECSICLTGINGSGETSACHVCSAKWHLPCIRRWITTSATCPMCRISLEQ